MNAPAHQILLSSLLKDATSLSAFILVGLGMALSSCLGPSAALCFGTGAVFAILALYLGPPGRSWEAPSRELGASVHLILSFIAITVAFIGPYFFADGHTVDWHNSLALGPALICLFIHVRPQAASLGRIRSYQALRTFDAVVGPVLISLYISSRLDVDRTWYQLVLTLLALNILLGPVSALLRRLFAQLELPAAEFKARLIQSIAMTLGPMAVAYAFSGPQVSPWSLVIPIALGHLSAHSLKGTYHIRPELRVTLALAGIFGAYCWSGAYGLGLAALATVPFLAHPAFTTLALLAAFAKQTGVNLASFGQEGILPHLVLGAGLCLLVFASVQRTQRHSSTHYGPTVLCTLALGLPPLLVFYQGKALGVAFLFGLSALAIMIDTLCTILPEGKVLIDASSITLNLARVLNIIALMAIPFLS